MIGYKYENVISQPLTHDESLIPDQKQTIKWTHNYLFKDTLPFVSQALHVWQSLMKKALRWYKTVNRKL